GRQGDTITVPMLVPDRAPGFGGEPFTGEWKRGGRGAVSPAQEWPREPGKLVRAAATRYFTLGRRAGPSGRAELANYQATKQSRSTPAGDRTPAFFDRPALPGSGTPSRPTQK